MILKIVMLELQDYLETEMDGGGDLCCSPSLLQQLSAKSGILASSS